MPYLTSFDVGIAMASQCEDLVRALVDMNKVGVVNVLRSATSGTGDRMRIWRPKGLSQANSRSTLRPKPARGSVPWGGARSVVVLNRVTERVPGRFLIWEVLRHLKYILD